MFSLVKDHSSKKSSDHQIKPVGIQNLQKTQENERNREDIRDSKLIFKNISYTGWDESLISVQ